MSRDPRRQLERPGYRWETCRPAHCLVFVAPLLAAFHAGSACVSAPLFTTGDLRRLLGVFGATAWYLPALLVGAALLIQHVVRGDSWHVRGRVLLGMVGESVLWALPLLAVNALLSRLLAANGMLAAGQRVVTADVLQAVGAGIYEEFVFRHIALGLVAWLLIRTMDSPARRDVVTLLVLLASSLAFGLYHHFPWPGHVVVPALNWGDVTWRTAAGVCLGLVYAYRGFGIAVGAHVVWDLYYVLVARA